MTVLIGYVPTPEGEAAFAEGVAEAQRAGDDLVILNSPREGVAVDADQISDPVAGRLLAAANAAGVTARMDQETHDGDILDTFEDAVSRTGARLIVIGLRRRSPVGKFLMGSQAQRILLGASVPVLAVKPTP